MSNALKTAKWLVVIVTGVTGGGKSELCTFLYHRLPCTTRLLRQDDYFLPVDSPRHVKSPGGVEHINWDIISSLDMDKMLSDVCAVISHPPVVCGEKRAITYTNMVVTNECEHLSVTSQEVLHNSLPCPGGKCPILLLDGFSILDDPRFVELSSLIYFFELDKAECIRRREMRSFEPPDVPGYFDACVYPMYEQYRERCLGLRRRNVQIKFIDGAAPQQNAYTQILNEILASAAIGQ